jgi:GxxExxY protein
MIEWVKECAETVYKEMGAGHTEAVYEACMAIELGYSTFPIIVTRQVPCPLTYKGFTVGVGFIDILADDLIVELKSVAKLTPKDAQQVQKYLIALDLDNGLLINFGNNLEIVEVQKGDHGETPSSES